METKKPLTNEDLTFNENYFFNHANYQLPKNYSLNEVIFELETKGKKVNIIKDNSIDI